MLHKRHPRFDSLPHYFYFYAYKMFVSESIMILEYYITQHSPSMACAGVKALTFSVILIATILTVSSVVAEQVLMKETLF